MNLIPLFLFLLIIKLIIISSRLDPGSTSIQSQKLSTSFFYSSMNGLGFITMISCSLSFNSRVRWLVNFSSANSSFVIGHNFLYMERSWPSLLTS